MKRMTVVGLLMGALSVCSTSAAAEEGHEHAAAPQTVTGEVVDLACYLGHGERGAGHRECAQKCIASGLPVGIKSEKGLYLVVGSEHGTANQQLASLAAKTVTAEGTVTERDGVRLLALKKVTVKE